MVDAVNHFLDPAAAAAKLHAHEEKKQTRHRAQSPAARQRAFSPAVRRPEVSAAGGSARWMSDVSMDGRGDHTRAGTPPAAGRGGARSPVPPDRWAPGALEQRQGEEMMDSTTQRLAAAKEADRARELLSLQITETRGELRHARDEARAAAAEAGVDGGSSSDVAAVRELLGELKEAQVRLRAEYAQMSAEGLAHQAAATIERVEGDMMAVQRQLESSQTAEELSHTLELLLAKEQLMQLSQNRTSARRDAEKAIAAIDQELWPGGKPRPASPKRPRSPVAAPRARTPTPAGGAGAGGARP